jgi:transcriptional regulator with XRE-family HTH domain
MVDVMSVMTPSRGVGELLRDWRQRRRLSQLDLAVEADVSARHLSFVETGRSKPSRELLLHLAEHLDVPLRERNAWLLAAGFAPLYPESSLDTDRMEPVREALDKILTGHEPFPAVIVDRHWDLVSANRPALAVMGQAASPELLTPPVNALRISLHPDGLAPHIVNLAEYSAHLLTRLNRQVILSGDDQLAALYDELRRYPGVSMSSTAVDTASLLFVPFVLRGADGEELSFFSTLATFGTALDITVAELAIESFFPADKATETALRVQSG